MKSKSKAYKDIGINLLNFMISTLISLWILSFIYKRLNSAYIYTTSPNYIYKLVTAFMAIKNNIFGDFIYLIILFIFISIIYTILSYKIYKFRYDNMELLVSNVEEMANGDLDRTIDVNSKDEIGKVANDINKIVKSLRNITIEERKAQQTKTDLITNVSHDLRTPLTSIIGYLNLIEEDKYKDEVELRYYINIAYEKSQNLNILINDLFELTKLQNNSLSINKIHINLVELISQVISYLNYQVNQENMEIRSKFSEDKLIVNVDADKFVRVFENLINNAIKYGSDGKYIDIVTKKESNRAIVEVINYGEPIPQVDLPFIFDRFYRVEKSRNRNDGGSGLGLAITKNIVEAHNGEIIVSSDSNKTIFKVSLPLEVINNY